MVTVLPPNRDSLTVLLVGELDHHEASKIRGEIDGALEKYRPQKLVIDFGGINFMDSSGIGLVMGRYKLIKSWGGKVEITNVPKNLKRVMKLAGLEKLARIDDGGEEQ